MSFPENYAYGYQRHGYVGSDGQRGAPPTRVVTMPVELQQRAPVGSRDVDRAARGAIAAPQSAVNAGMRGQVGWRNGY